MPTVRLAFTPAAAHVRTARLVAVAVARRAGVSAELFDEIRLAIGEACSRAVALHRQHGLTDLVEVALSDTAGFTIRVTDRAPIDAGLGPAAAAADPVALMEEAALGGLDVTGPPARSPDQSASGHAGFDRSASGNRGFDQPPSGYADRDRPASGYADRDRRASGEAGRNQPDPGHAGFDQPASGHADRDRSASGQPGRNQPDSGESGFEWSASGQAGAGHADSRHGAAGQSGADAFRAGGDFDDPTRRAPGYSAGEDSGRPEQSADEAEEAVAVGMRLALLASLVDQITVRPAEHGAGTEVVMSWPTQSRANGGRP